MMCELIKDKEGQSRIRWQCPLCRHKRDFHASMADDVGFFVVHHLMTRHRLSHEELLSYDPDLWAAINEYFGCMSDSEVLLAVHSMAP